MKKIFGKALPTFIFMALFALPATLLAQGQRPAVTSVFALTTTVFDSQKATAGQELVLRSVSDVMIDGQNIIPAGSSLICHVSDVGARNNEKSQSAVAIVIDKAVRKDGLIIPLQGIIAAVARPTDNSLSSDPAYGMLHSNEPKMSGAGAGNAARSGDLAASSKTSSTAAVATANLKGPMDGSFLLKEDSQGAIGYEELSISWSLASPPPVTIFTTRKKSFKLLERTQMLLRMVPPRRPQ